MRFAARRYHDGQTCLLSRSAPPEKGCTLMPTQISLPEDPAKARRSQRPPSTLLLAPSKTIACAATLIIAKTRLRLLEACRSLDDVCRDATVRVGQGCCARDVTSLSCRDKKEGIGQVGEDALSFLVLAVSLLPPLLLDLLPSDWNKRACTTTAEKSSVYTKMASLAALILLPLAASQFVSVPTNLTETEGYYNQTVRYKEVPDGICELTPGVKSYSGYVDVTSEESVFWWFFEARNGAPEDAPLTVWINGGPGSSSMIGLFEEIGPCWINEDGGVEYQEYAWK